MTDNVLIHEEEAAAAAELPDSGLYKLDWETATIHLDRGRFTHVLRRPSAEQLYKREEDLQQEIPIAKDGSYHLPDPTIGDDLAAALYDKLIVEASGYPGDVPQMHKIAAFNALFARECEVDEDADLLADQIRVFDEIGSSDIPDYTICHVMRQPSQSELNAFRRRAAANSHLKPGKRGRQIFVTRSNLKALAAFYDQWLIRLEGATVAGREWSDDLRADFLNAVDPLVKRKVASELVSKLSDRLQD